MKLHILPHTGPYIFTVIIKWQSSVDRAWAQIAVFKRDC